MPNLFCRGLTFALALSLLLGCSRQSPEEKLLDTAKPAASWIATLRMTGERWIANSVPKSFVKATVAEARTDLGKIAEEAGKSPARPAAIVLQRLLQDARSLALGLERAVKAGDRPAAARQVEQIDALQARMAAWQRQAGKAGGAP
jgi:hypothetical protein